MNKTNKDESRDVEHSIKVESTQVFRGEVTPSESEELTSDATRVDGFGREQTNVGVYLGHHKELKRTFECSCGERFRKGKTARNHLENES